MNKRGQMKMSFGMIFSIILIVIFIAFAIYGIQKFLSLQGSVNTDKFVSDLQSDVKTVWTSQQASTPQTYSIPNSIAQVCFQKGTDSNLVFVSDKGIPRVGGNIKYLNMSEIVPQGDEKCFNSTNGKITFTLKKNFGQTLVSLS